MSQIPPPSTLLPGSIVDCYVRDSGGPRQEASTEQQLAELTEYCQQYHLTLRYKFADIAKSGGTTVGREQFLYLVDLTRDPSTRPAAVLFWNYARIARNLDDATFYKALIRRRGVLIHSINDPIPEGEYGRIVEFLIDASNAEKRRQTSTDARRGLRDLVRTHGCVPGTPPRGFIRQPVPLPPRRDGSPRTGNRWVPDPDRKTQVQKAFALRAEGKSLKTINDLTHLFTSLNSYSTFFNNRIYIGVLEYGGLTLPDYCEPIVDIATWNTVQTLAAERSAMRTSTRHPRREHSTYLLSGLAHCGLCGAPLSGSTVVKSATNRYRSYRCTGATRKRTCHAGGIPAELLETSVLNTLKEYILTPEALEAAQTIQAINQAERERQADERRAYLRKEQAALQRQINHLTAAIADSGHSSALLHQLAERERHHADLAAELETLGQPPSPVPMLTRAEIAVQSDRLITHLSAHPEEAQPILRGFIHRIEVKKDGRTITGTIEYYLPPDSMPTFRDPMGAPLYKHTFHHPIIPARSTWQRQKRP